MANSAKQSKKKFHTVYKTTNLVNGKIYIGCHSTDDLNDGYLGSGDNIIKAVLKHGKQNFVKEILHVFDSYKEMLKTEAIIVNEDFIKRPDVYNIVLGGYGGVNKGSSDMKHLHKPETGEHCAVHKSVVERMLLEGWVIGRGYSSTSNTIWIHKENEKKMVNPDLLNYYLDIGWKKGLPESPTVGKTWIYNPTTEKYSLCNRNDLEVKISEGWEVKKWSPIPAGTVREKIQCQHCDKFAAAGNFKRWHGDKCKKASTS